MMKIVINHFEVKEKTCDKRKKNEKQLSYIFDGLTTDAVRTLYLMHTV